MKKIVLLFTIIFASMLCVNGQTIAELENRWAPKPIEPPKTCKEKFENFWWDFIDVFTPYDDLKGISYKYSKSFPVGVSYDYYWENLFKLGGELGVNWDKQEYASLNPHFYVAASPGIYLRFISIDLGIGALYSDSWEKTYNESTVIINGKEYNAGYSYELDYKCRVNFLLKPSASIHIPLSSWEEYFITLSVGYNYFFNFEELNGWSFGLGFHWAI